MGKQLSPQRYVYKIHSERLRKANWKLNLPIEEAHRNEEVIALADSQMLRWIDELNGTCDADEKIIELKKKIKNKRKEANTLQNRKEIKQLYRELDKLQYKPDYLCLIIDRKKDYYRACRGFSINGLEYREYRRLLGTPGGIKNSTIVFISNNLYPEIMRRLENDRDETKPIVPAKLEAYRALTCSASNPVSFPHGICVVNDVCTTFKDSVTKLENETGDEPVAITESNVDITIDASDGCGMMLPCLAERWSEELNLTYTTCAVNTRFSFEKGMAFTFDFREFGEKVAGSYLIEDAWGDTVDLREVELVLTTSMVKLWDSYSSCEDYVSKSLKNGYSFCISKTAPENLENERCLNYQFIQSFNLNESDIDELIKPTMDEMKEVLGGDWRKTVLFLKGIGLNDRNIDKAENDYAKAIMIEPSILNDSYVQSVVYHLIKNKINEAKIGVLKVHGNFSIVSGDLYLLCQSMFGLELTGLLKKGEIYNKHWSDNGAEELVCFRAPMTGHSNIRRVHPCKSEETAYWFRFINTCTLLNGWDTSCAALNGMDFDGDLVMLTDNDVLVRNHIEMPALMCIQKKSEKIIPVEADFVKANINSFGNDIGAITNRATSMYEVISHFDETSEEVEKLKYRINCSQLYQQDAIDRAKGIVSNPMPKEWYDYHSVCKMAEGEKKSLYKKIVADRKPYFMRYIYPDLMAKYNTYVNNTNKNCQRRFQRTLSDLMSGSYARMTERQKEFLKDYERRMPVGMGDCVMNRICRKFENEFDGHVRKHNARYKFDYRLMKSSVDYSPYQYNLVKKIFKEYNSAIRAYSMFATFSRMEKDEVRDELNTINAEFRRRCNEVCSNRFSLCNLILDLCYEKNSTKKFAWSMCGDEIIENLLENKGGMISFPVYDENGDFAYCGKTFRTETKKVEVSE